MSLCLLYSFACSASGWEKILRKTPERQQKEPSKVYFSDSPPAFSSHVSMDDHLLRGYSHGLLRSQFFAPTILNKYRGQRPPFLPLWPYIYILDIWSSFLVESERRIYKVKWNIITAAYIYIPTHRVVRGIFTPGDLAIEPRHFKDFIYSVISTHLELNPRNILFLNRLRLWQCLLHSYRHRLQPSRCFLLDTRYDPQPQKPLKDYVDCYVDQGQAMDSRSKIQSYRRH